jgi:hypothetical protein
MTLLLTIISLLLIIISPVEALPMFLKQYEAHPLHKPELVDCSLCHKGEGYGNQRNEFGKAFAKNKYKITEDLICKFPDRFKQAK